MKAVDDIIETIEANTLALDECKLGEWVHVETVRSGRKLYKFVPNQQDIPTSIRKGIGDMLNQMLMLIEHVQTISAEGVLSSVESAKLQLQVHKQDFVEVKNSMAETTKEIEHKPLWINQPLPTQAGIDSKQSLLYACNISKSGEDDIENTIQFLYAIFFLSCSKPS